MLEKSRIFVLLALAVIIGCAGSAGVGKGKGQPATHSPERGWFNKTSSLKVNSLSPWVIPNPGKTSRKPPTMPSSAERPGMVKIRLAVARNKLTLILSNDRVGVPKYFKQNGGLGLHFMNHRSKIIGADLSIQAGRKDGTVAACSLRPPAISLH